MRRWNGWGDDTITYPLPVQAQRYLEAWVGPGTPPKDATWEEALAAIPPSRLPDHPLISKDAGDRLRHARGQSLPDWVFMRSGRVPIAPDGVAHPTSAEEVRALLRFAADVGVRLIPYGGGTSVVGHINPPPGESPVLTVDMGRMNRLRHLDETSQLATFGAGVAGPDLEAQLRARGFTLGHFPQSFELSTLGGWVATRSSGQQSLKYGRIEQLFAGGRLESPAGTLVMPAFPASAAGPDLREMVLGSEGRLGVLTEVTVRVSPLPEKEAFHAVFFPDWESGLEAVRAIMQARLPLSMLRLSGPAETEMTLALAGHERLIWALEQWLAMRGVGREKCLALMGFSGERGWVCKARRAALALARRHGGVHAGTTFGRQWQKTRFKTPYLRNTLWEQGFAVDTLETATSWSRIPAMVQAIEDALRGALKETGERVHVFSHLSHPYPHGSSVYTTYIFRLASDPEQTLQRWQALKSAASQAIVAHGGTISHQHGVGEDHKQYLGAEKGELGLRAIQDLCRRLDPQGLMNPGKLV